MQKKVIVLIGLLLIGQMTIAQRKIFNVKEYGAKGKESEVVTKIIQQAIDDCAEYGGGLVYFPEGTFISGTIILKENVTLYLSEKSILKGSSKLEDYPFHETSHKFAFYTSSRSFNATNLKLRSFILADSVSNVGISGKGIIDGSGDAEEFDISKKPVRPLVLRFINCKNVNIEDVTLKNSPSWMQIYVNCNDVNINGITVHNHTNKNNDGIDIVGCQDVSITNCDINADDDGICLKTLSQAKCQNILISNCRVRSNCNAIKIGTESVSNFENIVITNCVITKSGVMSHVWKREIALCGIALETVDGGHIKNIVISNIVSTGAYSPLFIRLGNRGRRYDPDIETHVGKIQDVYISNFVGIAERRPELSISGITGHYIEGVTLTDVKIKAKGDKKAGREEVFRDVPEAEDKYPEVLMFGPRLPAYGMFIRHVKNLHLDNVKLEYEVKDIRPALFMDDVIGAEVLHLKPQDNAETTSTIHLKNCQNIFFNNTINQFNAPKLFYLDGENTANIIIKNNFKLEDDKILNLSDKVNKNRIKIE